MPGSFWKEVRSFKLAGHGIVLFFRKDRHGRSQLLILILGLFTAWLLNCSIMEMFVILMCGGGVICLEMFNHALERLADMVHPDIDIRIKHIKDISAGAVFFFSLISLIAGIYIFGSKML